MAASWLQNYRFTATRIPRASKVQAVVGRTGLGGMLGSRVAGIAGSLATSVSLPSGGKKEGKREMKYLKGRGYRCTMTSEVPYAAVHEDSAPKRPSAEPGLESASKKFPDIIDKEIARVLKEYGW